MDEIFLVYKTDVWHSYASRDLIGVATSQKMAVVLCQYKANKEGKKIKGDQLFNLENIKQTQGYKGEGEFMYEAVNTDTLL